MRRKRRDSLGSSSWASAPVPSSDRWSSEGNQELPLLKQEEEVTSQQGGPNMETGSDRREGPGWDTHPLSQWTGLGLEALG